jgi:hypothetical protein
MARIGISGLSLYPCPLSSSTTSLTIYELASGIISIHTDKGIFPSPADKGHRKIAIGNTTRTRKSFFSKMASYNPLCRVFSRSTPKTVLPNININDVNEERIAGEPMSDLYGTNSQLTNPRSDVHIDSTCLLRSTPLSSVPLSDEVKTHDRTPAKISNLLSTDDDNAPQTAVEPAKDLQHTTHLPNIHEAKHNTPASTTTPISIGAHHESLAARRAEYPGIGAKHTFTLENFTELNAVAAQNDYALLCHKKRENPDFPIIPIWHKDSTAQRNELDFVAQLSEDRAAGFFVHGCVIEVILEDSKYTEAAPDAEYIQEMRAYGFEECQKMLDAEVKAAKDNEPNRLLRVKIEPFLTKVGGTLKKDKALRLVSIEMLMAANLLELSDHDIIAVLKTEMQKVIASENELAAINDVCICDILSNYSNDVGLDYWQQPKVMDALCNEEKRQRISDWASNVEHVVVLHKNVHMYDILEPNHDCAAMIWAEIALKAWPYGGQNGPMIAFQLSEDKQSIALPLIDGCPTERSEGFFTNMSGLTDVSSNVSSTRCGSDSDSGSNNKNDDKNGSSSQSSANQACSYDEASQKEPHPFHEEKREHHPEQQPKNHARTRIPGPQTPGRKYTRLAIEHRAKACTQPRPYSRATHPILNKKVAAMADPKHIDARRFDNLHRAWDMPHRAHGPQQPGFRRIKEFTMIPSPDWDAPGVQKPNFAQRDEQPGKMDAFMAYFGGLSPEHQAARLGKHDNKDAGKRLRYSSKLRDDVSMALSVC